MEEFFHKSRLVIEFMGGILFGLLLGDSGTFQFLVGMAALDVVAGTVRAMLEGRAISSTFLKGFARKLIMFVALRAVDLASRAPGLPALPFAPVAVAGGFAVHELISILEHCAAAFWLPAFVRRWLLVARRADGEEVEEHAGK